MQKALLVLVLTLFTSFLCFAETPNEYLILRSPALSKTQIAFTYAGDLWVVARDGGMARRLTAGVGDVTHPAFSPDGAMIAYTAKVDGNRDVYVIPANGGVSKRITFHPGDDIVTGWTPDGKNPFPIGTE